MLLPNTAGITGTMLIYFITYIFDEKQQIHDCYVDRESLAFATEPILCSVANVLGQHDNLPPSALFALKDYTLFDVEIKYGLLQVITSSHVESCFQHYCLPADRI